MLKARFETVIDKETGEVVSRSERMSSVKFYKEVGYLKVYGLGLKAFVDLRGFEVDVLAGMLELMTYENQVHLSHRHRDELCAKLKIKPESLRRVLHNLRAYDAVYKQESKFYLINPFMFAKGRWKEIRLLRDGWHKAHAYAGEYEEDDA